MMLNMLDVNSLDEYSRMIDHLVLDPALTDEEIVKGCALAVEYNARSIVVRSDFVGTLARLLPGTGLTCAAAVAFPHGAMPVAVKVFAARTAVESGAEELEFVINTGKARSAEWGFICDEIGAVNEVVVQNNAKLRVILETGLLTDAQLEQLCVVCGQVAPAFVKNSTMFGPVDSDPVARLALMARTLPPSVKLCACGGVDSLDKLLLLRKMGIAHISTNATAAIMDEVIARISGE